MDLQGLLACFKHFLAFGPVSAESNGRRRMPRGQDVPSLYCDLEHSLFLFFFECATNLQRGCAHVCMWWHLAAACNAHKRTTCRQKRHDEKMRSLSWVFCCLSCLHILNFRNKSQLEASARFVWSLLFCFYTL